MGLVMEVFSTYSNQPLTVKVPNFSQESRGKILDHLINNDKNTLPAAIRTELENVTEGYTPLDIKRLWNDVAIRLSTGKFGLINT